jgi:hypothetical protein
VPPDEYTLISEYDAEPQFHFYEGIVRGPVYVYRNDRFLRRAFFVSEVVLAADEGAAVQALQHASARTTAVVLAPATGGTSSGSSADSIDAVSVRPGSLDFVTRSANRRFVVVSEVWHPGWQASVDHRAASLYRTDVALLGLWLEPGEHTVSLRFLPPGRRTGVIASGCTLVSVLVLASTRRPRRRPRGGLVHRDRHGRWQHASKAL